MKEADHFLKVTLDKAVKVFYISPEEYQNIRDHYCADKIAENQNPIPFYTFRRMQCITTGGFSVGRSLEGSCIYQITHESNYTSSLQPKKYMDHWNEVSKGNRVRSYQGMLIITSKGRFVVTSKEMVVLPSEDINKQTTLF